VIDFFAAHIAKPRAGGQSFARESWPEFQKKPSSSKRGRFAMRLLHSLVPALALLVSSSALAQSIYPDRPIKMIVPLAAASAVDVAARIVTQKMAENMGQQIVIINQAGASGLIGAEQPRRTATPSAASTTAS